MFLGVQYAGALKMKYCQNAFISYKLDLLVNCGGVREIKHFQMCCHFKTFS